MEASGEGATTSGTAALQGVNPVAGPLIDSGGLQPSGDQITSKMQEEINKVNDPKKKKSFDDKLQMAAVAAQLGSALFAGGQAPPPPSVPRGGGINMRPVSARDLYGG
jgi:hypothetical protein